MSETWSGPLRGSLFGLAPDGVFRASALALGAVGSYPTFSPLPVSLAKLRRFKFLWHCPSASLAAWPPACIPEQPGLRGIAPCGVRTFLPRLAPGAVLHPSKITGKLTQMEGGDKAPNAGFLIRGASQFVSHRRAKHQAPNPKLQGSSKSQNIKRQKQMPGQTARRSVFELGAWCCFGAWSLEFGACRLGSQPLKN